MRLIFNSSYGRDIKRVLRKRSLLIMLQNKHKNDDWGQSSCELLIQWERSKCQRNTQRQPTLTGAKCHSCRDERLLLHVGVTVSRRRRRRAARGGVSRDKQRRGRDTHSSGQCRKRGTAMENELVFRSSIGVSFVLGLFGSF